MTDTPDKRPWRDGTPGAPVVRQFVAEDTTVAGADTIEVTKWAFGPLGTTTLVSDAHPLPMVLM